MHEDWQRHIAHQRAKPGNLSFRCGPTRGKGAGELFARRYEIWVEHNDVHGELKWFKAKVVIVSPTSEVPSASVVRVHFLDGQKSNLNLMCPPDSDKLETRNPNKYEQFDWSTKPTYSDNWSFLVD